LHGGCVVTRFSVCGEDDTTAANIWKGIYVAYFIRLWEMTGGLTEKYIMIDLYRNDRDAVCYYWLIVFLLLPSEFLSVISNMIFKDSN